MFQRACCLCMFFPQYGGRNEDRLKFKGKLGTQAFCLPLVPRGKPYILPDHSRPIQVVVDPCLTDPSFDSTILAIMHNVSTVNNGLLILPPFGENCAKCGKIESALIISYVRVFL